MERLITGALRIVGFGLLCLPFAGCPLVIDDMSIGFPDGEPTLAEEQNGEYQEPLQDELPGDGVYETDQEANPLVEGLDLELMEGNVRLYLTDAPAAFDAVWVTIDKVEIESGAGSDTGWITLADEPRTLDLLQLQNDVTTVLSDADLEPGYYGQMRMIVSEASVELDGHSESLFIPSGDQTGIKFNLDFEVVESMAYVLVVDFDAHKSIKQTGKGRYMMSPVIVTEFIGEVDETQTVDTIYDVDEDGDAALPEDETAEDNIPSEDEAEVEDEEETEVEAEVDREEDDEVAFETDTEVGAEAEAGAEDDAEAPGTTP